MTKPAGAPRRPIGRRTLLCAIPAALLAGSLRAQPRSEVRAIVADDSATTRLAVEALKQRIPTLTVVQRERPPLRRPSTVALAIGPAALRAALDDNGEGPVMSLFSSQSTFNRLAGAMPSGARRVSAIFAEAAPEAQLQLIRALFERKVAVGVLLSETTAHLEARLERAARRHDLELKVHRVAPGANVVRELNVLVASDVLLALPDPNLYSGNTLPSLLDSTYRRGKPLIGFSASFVEAGALAAAIATAEDVAAQVQDALADPDPSRLPEPAYPLYWRVVVNEQVARSLNIPIADTVRALGNRPSGRGR